MAVLGETERAEALAGLGRHADAVAAWEQVIALSPASEQARYRTRRDEARAKLPVDPAPQRP